jgi:photosystem II stability/assembly factor-like uncharacterized protein
MTKSLFLLGIISLFVFCVSSNTFGQDQWTPVGPEGGYVTALAINPNTPNTLYAGTQGSGVFKSTNGGANWRAVNIGLTNTTVNALAIDPNTPNILYAETGRGVFKSTDGGANWTATMSGFP